MANIIKVTALPFGDSIVRVNNWKNINKKNPLTVNVNGTTIQWKDWEKAYKNVLKIKVGKFTFLQMLDSYNRVKKWQKTTKKNPLTVRVDKTVLSWTQWKKYYKVFKPIVISIEIPSTINKLEDNKKEILPVFHFNQQTVPYWGEKCCGPVSALIGVSYYGYVDKGNFQDMASKLIKAMNTGNGGTHPGYASNGWNGDLQKGFNSYFDKLKMDNIPFTEANIKKSIENGIPLEINVLTDSSIGYKGRFGHYIAITGYKNGSIGVSDPHGFNIGRGYRYWYPYSTIKKVVENNGSRPIWRILKK